MHLFGILRLFVRLCTCALPSLLSPPRLREELPYLKQSIIIIIETNSIFTNNPTEVLLV